MHTLALVASLSLTPGCAKLHHKLHKHKHASEELAYAPFPAKSSHAGLASVSPQMPTMVNSTVSKQEPVAFSAAPGVIVQPPLTAPQSPARSELRTSPFATDSAKSQSAASDEAKSAQVPSPVTITPATPSPATPSISKPAVSQSSQAELKPPAADVKKPASEAGVPPSVEPKQPATPPELPSTDKLPIDLPKDLPPPPASPNLSNRAEGSGVGSSGNPSVSVATNPATASPFAAGAGTAKSQTDNVITLSQPGNAPESGPETITAPAEVKPSAPSAPSVTNASNTEVSELAGILEKTRRTFADTSNYKVEVTLQERMNGRLLPQDKFVLYKRRQPLAVRMEWTEGKDVGREVIFSPAETKGMIQIRMPKGLIPRISMAPDSPLVRSKSRHPIDEAGADSVVDRLMATLQKFEAGHPDAGSLSVESAVDPQLGPIRRVTHHTIEREIWVVDMDENTGLPLTIHATDETGELLEHYEFRGYQLNLPELLTAEAFDHNARWGNQKLFGRLASGNSKEESTKR